MIAVVFPGQGAQKVGMGRALHDEFPICRETFREADEALGEPLSRLCFEGPDADLVLTENTQPAILAVSVAIFRLAESRGLRASFAAGHSLGEYSAHVAAGTLSFADALRTVRRRGRYMQEAVPVGVGAMAALIGADLEVASRVCREAEGTAGEVVSVANDNAPGQVVIAGHAAAVDRAIELAKEKGVKRALKLPVSAPFHCELMRPAQERLAVDLRRVSFRDLEVPLVNNADARAIRSGEEARESLIRQVTARVRWTESIRRLAELEVGAAIEAGPGQVLAGLVKRIDPSMRVVSAGDLAGIDAAAAFASGEGDA